MDESTNERGENNRGVNRLHDQTTETENGRAQTEWGDTRR